MNGNRSLSWPKLIRIVGPMEEEEEGFLSTL
jgi:hypothetical protein